MIVCQHNWKSIPLVPKTKDNNNSSRKKRSPKLTFNMDNEWEQMYDGINSKHIHTYVNK